ncbi:hypothetical protein [Halarchaeum nitratireducens]|uniref:Uncharacterized protein n=1 Tax=Halarchaeum nitratireducens TaxID=489913 RepID=A0A830GF05_9EURY|nr:hypothetical protein [Halarchaeum nitratireducens]GGN24878.1 hypothetical protein GCM10009021_28400 [Halarchaeum nitratireducens]
MAFASVIFSHPESLHFELPLRDFEDKHYTGQGGVMGYGAVHPKGLQRALRTLDYMEDSWTPLTSAQREVLDLIVTHVEATEEAVTRDAAVTQLVEEGIERADARDRIEQLLLKGYLYEVGDEIRIPPYDSGSPVQ